MYIYIHIFLYMCQCVSVCFFNFVCIIYKYSTHSLCTGSVSAFCFTFILTLTLFIYIVPCFLPSASSSSRSTQRSRRKSRPRASFRGLFAHAYKSSREKQASAKSVGRKLRQLPSEETFFRSHYSRYRRLSFMYLRVTRRSRVVAGEMHGKFLLSKNHRDSFLASDLGLIVV